MATNFLEAAGTNGFITTPFNLMSTELNSLANGSGATSSVGGSSGVFSQTNTSDGIWGKIYLTATTTFTPTAGASISGWFLFSPDGGTTFETNITTSLDARSPDFIIPLHAAALGSSSVAAANGITQLPWWSFKVFVVNNSGVSLPASGNLIKVAPVAVQY